MLWWSNESNDVGATGIALTTFRDLKNRLYAIGIHPHALQPQSQ
jgi:hypothetical protein